MSNDFISESIKLWFKLAADKLPGEQGGVAGDAVAFASTEVFESIRWRMDVKDIGTVKLCMEPPNRVNTTRVSSSIILVNVIAVSTREFNNSGIIQHP